MNVSKISITQAFARTLLVTSAMFLASSAMAGTITADAGTGTIPAPLNPIIVAAADFQGPGANSLVIGPQSLTLSLSAIFTIPANLVLSIANASFAVSYGAPTISVAQRNLDGSVGTYYNPGGSISILSGVIIASGMSSPDPWSFIRIQGLNYTNAAALGTAGTSVQLSAQLTNTSGFITFESIASTAVVTSADVPAPGALGLLGLGLFGIGGLRKKKHTA